MGCCSGWPSISPAAVDPAGWSARCRGWRLSVMEALFPALFGLFAVAVRRLPGWPPQWFALVWSLQEWLKSSVPFGGFPWGVVGFGQANGPFLSLAQLGGVPLLSFAIALLGTLAVRAGPRDRSVVPAQRCRQGRRAIRACPRWCCPASVSSPSCSAPRWSRRGCGSRYQGQATNRASRWRRSRATCPGWGWSSTASAAPCWTTTSETVQLAEDVPRRPGAAGRFVIWPENSSDIDPMTNADAAQQIAVAARAVGAPILVGAVIARPDWTRTTRPPPTASWCGTR